MQYVEVDYAQGGAFACVHKGSEAKKVIVALTHANGKTAKLKTPLPISYCIENSAEDHAAFLKSKDALGEIPSCKVFEMANILHLLPDVLNDVRVGMATPSPSPRASLVEIEDGDAGPEEVEPTADAVLDDGTGGSESIAASSAAIVAAPIQKSAKAAVDSRSTGGKGATNGKGKGGKSGAPPGKGFRKSSGPPVAKKPRKS